MVEGRYNIHRAVRKTCKSLITASSETERLWIDNSFLVWRGETGHSFNGYAGVADSIHVSKVRQVFESDDSFVTTEAIAEERRRGIERLTGGGALQRLRQDICGLIDTLYERRRVVHERDIQGYTEMCEKIVTSGLFESLGLSLPDLTLLCATLASVRNGSRDGILTDDTGIIAGAGYARRQGINASVYSRILPYARSRVEAERLTDKELDYFLERKTRMGEGVL